MTSVNDSLGATASLSSPSSGVVLDLSSIMRPTAAAEGGPLPMAAGGGIEAGAGAAAAVMAPVSVLQLLMELNVSVARWGGVRGIGVRDRGGGGGAVRLGGWGGDGEGWVGCGGCLFLWPGLAWRFMFCPVLLSRPAVSSCRVLSGLVSS